ncbi:MAG: spore protease YyaC [Bacillaceae bacterium]|nr:spore protease YyaC [Bacillaceae bacterium]
MHINENSVTDLLTEKIMELIPTKKEIVIVCIGTDRSTGDSLGPLIGKRLKELNVNHFHIFGTLENPVHAVNLEETLRNISELFYNPFIIAIDACLGKSTSIGYISLDQGPVKPGAAVKKNLPEVGDIHITGIVNVGGFMEYMVLQNTRLHLVMKMADVIAESLYYADKKHNKVNERFRHFINTSKSLQ